MNNDVGLMLAMAEGLAASNAYNSQSRRSEYVRSTGSTPASRKKRKAQTKARKKNQRKKK